MRRLLLLALVTLFGVGAVGVASASTPVTIGQTNPAANRACGDGVTAVQTAVSSGTSYTVPAGNWSITAWSTYAHGGTMALVVLRPTATLNVYTVVGRSATQTLAAVSVLQTFGLLPGTADPPIAVQGGDLLGFHSLASQGCNTDAGAGDSVSTCLPQCVGSQINFFLHGQRLLNISATLTPTVEQQVSDLLTDVTGVGAGESFADKITAIQGYIAANDTASACAKLDAFINEVNAQAGKKITEAQAGAFTTQANDIKASLGC
jgi:hypothetical protein